MNFHMRFNLCIHKSLIAYSLSQSRRINMNLILFIALNCQYFTLNDGDADIDFELLKIIHKNGE